MKKRWKYSNAEIGEIVCVKKTPVKLYGEMKGQTAKIVTIFPKDVGIQVEFTRPIIIQYEGFAPQKVKTFTLRTSYLSYH